VFVGFAPWIVFAAVAKAAGWEAGATAALLSAAILTWPGRGRGSLRAPEAGALVLFGLLVLAGLLVDRSEVGDDLAVAAVMGVLAGIMFWSLLFTPTAEQYARERASEEDRRRVGFRDTYRHLTLVWGLAFAAVAAAALAQELTGSDSVLLGWIVPVVAVVGGFRYHLWYVAEVQTFARAESSVGPATAAAQRP
jgi:putative flippase GtrA